MDTDGININSYKLWYENTQTQQGRCLLVCFSWKILVVFVNRPIGRFTKTTRISRLKQTSKLPFSCPFPHECVHKATPWFPPTLSSSGLGKFKIAAKSKIYEVGFLASHWLANQKTLVASLNISHLPTMDGTPGCMHMNGCCMLVQV